jgi:hypothetical protein
MWIPRWVYFLFSVVFSIAALNGMLNDRGPVIVMPALAAIITAILGWRSGGKK